MCGFVAFLGGDSDARTEFVNRGVRLLVHRGPDDAGVYSDGNVAFGHRRLAILDLTEAGHQPMISPDGRWVLAYNGEIYNHLAVRARLCKDWSFVGHSDTETVLAALSLHGPDALEHFVGMWALALWDAREERLLVSRDRYGQKPLYWRRCSDGSLRFSSEIKPLFDDGEHPAAYGPALAEYLATGNYGHLGERTFFRDIFLFPPAHWAIVRAGDRRPEPRRYWRFPADASEARPYDETVKLRFRAAFEEAVSSQLMSDVPVGATLSGGLDSSSVVAVMASASRGPIPIFTAQTDGSAYDESAYVRAVQKRWEGRLDVEWVPLHALDRIPISTMLMEAIRVQEEPFGDPSIAAHGLLMDAARASGVPVVLGGQGGDELLFGYPIMRDALIAASLRKGRRWWALMEARASAVGVSGLAHLSLAAIAPHVEVRTRAISRRRRRSWLLPGFVQAAHDDIPALSAPSNTDAFWLEMIERMSLPHLVHYDDRNGMARSIEGRMPFLDHRLAEIVGSLRPDAFLEGGALKRILRDALGDMLPSEVLDRRDKIGFYTPLREMLRSDIGWVTSMLSDEFARSLGLFDVEAIAAEASIAARSDSPVLTALRVWRALSVRVWAETFKVTVPLASHDSDVRYAISQ